MQEHFERLSFLFSEMKVSVVLKHCAVKIEKLSTSGTVSVLTDEKENITDSRSLFGWNSGG